MWFSHHRLLGRPSENNADPRLFEHSKKPYMTHNTIDIIYDRNICNGNKPQQIVYNGYVDAITVIWITLCHITRLLLSSLFDFMEQL